MKCYPLELFLNNALASSVLCEIQKGVLNNPLMSTCGHSFCKSCVTTHLETSDKCPKCKTILEKDRLISSEPFEKILSALEIKCQNFAFGCEWTDSLSKNSDHISQCPFTPKKCPFCEFLGCEEDVDLHKESCTEKSMSCLACLKKFKVSELKSHADYCENMIVNCSNGCSEKIRKKDMDFHITETCLLSTQKCRFSVYGCPFEGLAKEIIDHVDSIGVTLYHSKIKLHYEKNSNDQMIKLISELNENCVKGFKETVKTLKNFEVGAELFANDIKEVINPKKQLNLFQKEKNLKTNYFEQPKKLKNISFFSSRNRNKIMNIPQNKLSFSKFNKGNNIQIINKGLSVVGTKGAYEIAALVEKAIPYRHYVFCIESQTSWIGLGLINIRQLQNNQFKFKYNRINNGCYFMFSNGYHMVNNQATSFYPSPSFSFTGGDKVDMLWASSEQKIIFTNVKTQTQSIMFLESNVNHFYPAVHVYNKGCEVTIE